MMKGKYTLKTLGRKTNELFDFDVFKKTRTNEYAFARFIMFKVAYEKGYSLHQIGKAYGFNHATVLNGIYKYKDAFILQDYEYNYEMLRYEFGLSNEYPVKDTDNVQDKSFSWLLSKFNKEQRQTILTKYLIPLAKEHNIL